ncbi:MAG: metal ABC transporter permease [Deltaproteobacteria bacterium]|nr:metal ABC transporter permease [Deltaproteobacteria bacterium]
MDQLIHSIPVLISPFFACLVIAGLHCYMGLHVLKRGVIFVDLALAQCAALGAAVALFLLPIIWPETLEFHETEALSMAAEESLAMELSLEDDEHLLESIDSTGIMEGMRDHAEYGHDRHRDQKQKRKQIRIHAHDNTGYNQGNVEPATVEYGGHDHHALENRFSYIMSLVFALLGAALLSFGRFRNEQIPHEAIIGIIFVVCAALSVLILSKAPHGHDKMEAMLIGSILFVNSSQVINMLGLYLFLGVLHLIFRHQFITISEDVAAADRAGIRVRLWDCLFFATFALMVTQSVGIAGVYVVFSYLIIPAACGKLFGNRFGSQLLIAWGIAILTTIIGLFVSAVWDMPTGSSLVSCFGGILVVSIVLRWIQKGKEAPSKA